MEEEIRKMRTLPLLPLRGVVVFPYMMMHLDIGRERSIEAVEQAMLDGKEIFLAAQMDAEVDEPKAEDIYKVGTVAEIRQMIKLPGDTIRVLVEGKHRAIFRNFRENKTYTEVDIEEYFDQVDTSMQMEAMTRSVVDKFEEWVRLSKKIPPETLISVSIIDDAGRLADLIINHMNLNVTTRQSLLSAINVHTRLEKLYEVLLRELEVLKLQQKISAQVKKSMDKAQHDYYLREQIKAIRAELGEKDSKTEEVENGRKRLKEGNYPDEVRETIEKELNRLEGMNSMNVEISVIANYVDWLLDLPWNTVSEDTVDINKAAKILDHDHYGLKKVKDRILDYLAVHQLAPDKNAPILCLVGPPGVGKTSLAASIARATGRKFVRASLGGVTDEAELRGHRRTYVGAMPGRIIENIRKAGVKNPVFLLDEVDKMGLDYKGDPTSALLEILDPAQNSTFSDHYIELPFDLSKVLWIVTANNYGNIPRPLRDRMETIELSTYTEFEKLEIAKKHLVPRQREANGLKAKDVHFGNGVLKAIIEDYTRESGVRELERMIGQACRKAARKLVEGEEAPIAIKKKNLTDFLGKIRFVDTKANQKPEIGVVTGMAWTEVGGTLLPTEVTVMPGKGNLMLTGQLGKVMQESAEAGFTYVRSHSKDLGLKDDFYQSVDIHIHLPEGAIPKDGPSAGITMATAVTSALTHRKVRSDLAMTGEITLRGNVLPIGGLKEKVLAAYSEGIKTIILPKDNERDIEDIPKDIREKIEFKPVEHMDEVLHIALLPAEVQNEAKEVKAESEANA